MNADNTNPVLIYISAAADVMAEREALARMIARLPVTLAWQVGQTPLGEERVAPELPAAAELHILVMGGDIRAPVGLELYTVRAAGRPTVAFLKRGVARTIAGDIFIKESRLAWQPFAGAVDLSRRVQQTIAAHLLRHALRFALSPVEVEALQALLTNDSPAEPPATTGAEAGHSAVILSRERYTPSQGIIIDEEA